MATGRLSWLGEGAAVLAGRQLEIFGCVTMMGEQQAESEKRRYGLLSVALVGGFFLRLGTWPQVFAGGRTWLDGPDSYYHLRRAWLTLHNWPRPPQTDMLIGVPEGGPISWPPVFDLLLATVALPWRGAPEESFERIGASLPPLLGVIEILMLYGLVRRLFGATAAAWSALFAAILPGVVRYSLLGALDHDPLVETVALIALVGLAGGLSRSKASWYDIGCVGVGLTVLVLTWAGAVLHLGLLCCLVAVVEYPALKARRASPMAVALGGGGLIAAGATLPFVLRSVWTEQIGATFIGLSWLHTAALLAVAVAGLAMAVWTRPERKVVALLAAATCGLLALVSSAWPALRAGLTFFARGEPFLQGVMESRPLLSLFGSLDFSAPIIRLSFLPLLIPILLPWSLRRAGADRRLVFIWTWLLYTLAIALIQSRYAHAAALPIAALAGVLIARFGSALSQRPRRWLVSAVIALVAVPSLPAYLAIPGLEPFRLFGRLPKIITTGMFEVCDFLRDEVGPSESWADHRTVSSSAVLAPWSTGHWLIWSGRQGTVTTPLGPQGQPAFVDGIRFYLESDPDTVHRLLDRHRVRYFVATAQVPPLRAYTDLAGVDPEAVFSVADGVEPLTLDARKYLTTVAARLTWIGPQEVELFGQRLAALDGYREVFRSSRTRPNPFLGAPQSALPSEVPLVRVFEILERP